MVENLYTIAMNIAGKARSYSTKGIPGAKGT